MAFVSSRAIYGSIAVHRYVSICQHAHSICVNYVLKWWQKIKKTFREAHSTLNFKNRSSNTLLCTIKRLQYSSFFQRLFTIICKECPRCPFEKASENIHYSRTLVAWAIFRSMLIERSNLITSMVTLDICLAEQEKTLHSKFNYLTNVKIDFKLHALSL